MKKSAYDELGARTLLPMLRSIMTELRERGRAIETLEQVVLDAALGASAGSAEVLNAIATLAEHRRNVRLATEELARLGCRLDDDHPLRIQIPGESGDIHTGFVWDAASEAVERTSVLATSLTG